MAMIEIPDELDILLEHAAMRAGQTKDEFLHGMIAAQAEEESLPLSAFTEAQLERMKESVGQVSRGAVYPSEHVARNR